jgi:hypothetical protein
MKPSILHIETMAQIVLAFQNTRRRPITDGGSPQCGLCSQEKGHGGDWTIACDPEKTTMLDIYRALGEPGLFAMSVRSESPAAWWSRRSTQP